MQKLVKNKKKVIINVVVILVVTALTLFYFLKNGIINDIGKIKDFSIWGVVAILCMVLGYVLLDTFIIHNSVKSVKAKLNFGNCVEAYLFGNLGSGVTPCKSGHFPFIFYYYAKKGLPFDQSLNIVSQNQIIYSSTTILLYLAFSIVCAVNHFELALNGLTIQLYLIALVGFAVNLFSLSFVLLMSFSARFQNFFINISAKVLLKLKKIDDKDKYIAEQQQKMQSYRTQIKYLCTHLYKAVVSMLAYVVFLVLMYSTPYVVYIFLCNQPFDFMTYLLFLSLAQAMTYITNIIPVPGGTGVAEFSFITVFASLIPSSMVNVAVVVWRFFTYYLLILIDFVCFLFVMRKPTPDSAVETLVTKTTDQEDLSKHEDTSKTMHEVVSEAKQDK